jgi:hypothetical protein
MGNPADSTRLLSIYLNDHFAGASAGRDAFYRVAGNMKGGPVGRQLLELAEEIAEDRDRLRRIMRLMNVGESRGKSLLARAGERLGRFKPNGFLVRRSPLSDLLELEALRVAVAGKTAGWEAMLASPAFINAGCEPELTELRERALDQANRLQTLHASAARQVLAGRAAHEGAS